MSSDIAIRVTNLSKCYEIFDTPRDRLKQFIMPKINRAVAPLKQLFNYYPAHSNKYYKEYWALHDVSFEVKRGEAVGIIGRNGAGKSTLLQLICGTLTPTSGTVETFGRVSALLELGAGFNPEFTGVENIYLSGLMLGLSPEQIDQKYDEILSFADIGDHVYLPVKTYSSGMFMRLAFSVATSVDPDILVIDEALSVGDASFQMKCASRIKSIIEKKDAALLFVSHSEYSVRSLCEKALYLNAGKQIAFGFSSDVVALYNSDILYTPNETEACLDVESQRNIVVEKEIIETSMPEQKDFFKITIKSIDLLDNSGERVNLVSTGQLIHLKFTYILTGNLCEPISFVFNLYRKDGVYVLGTTTLMEGIEPVVPSSCGEVVVTFPNFNLLSGYYFWRVAINDQSGLTILDEAKNVCEFRVKDDFSCVGLVGLDRTWRIVNGAHRSN